jgi:Mg2+-importing ATPase
MEVSMMHSHSSIHERAAQYACADTEKLFRDFHISEDGYDPAQVERSRELYGENILPEGKGDSVGRRLRRAFVNPFTMILFVLAVISFFTDVLLASNFSRDGTTVIIIVSMLLLSGIMRFIQEMRAKRITDRLSSILRSEVLVRRSGNWQRIPSSELVVGDRVRLLAGDPVPADLRLTAAQGLLVSQSSITGESGAVGKDAAPLPSEQARSWGEYRNLVFLGSSVIAGTGEGVVLAVGRDTVYGGFSGSDRAKKDRFDQGANSIAWVLIRFMATLVPIVFVAFGLTKGDWFSAFLFALSVAVGLTPELLPMVVNACLAKGSAAMEAQQTVVKNISAMQGFGSMDVLCVDKTGTLTGDTLVLEYYLDILGNESRAVLDLAYLNSLYHAGTSNHLDAAILQCAEFPGQGEAFAALAQRRPRLAALPFDYERKFASVLVGGEEENLLIVKGSADEVCARCIAAEYGGERLPMGPDGSAQVHSVIDEMLDDGMKVLAVAYKPMESAQLAYEDERDLILLGYVVFFDAPKKSAAGAIQKLRSLHVQIKVLTGDQKGVALSVCRRLGIDTTEVLTGPELDALTEEEAPIRIEQTSVFAQLTPRQKVEVLRVLQSNGHTVGFLGDGLNDLPAITAADVGISVDTAAEAVKESADVLLLKKDLHVLEAGILEGRKAFANMSKYIRITASSNFGNIFAIVIASVFLPFFPMTSVQLLLLNLLYDLLCLVLPWDSVDPEICARPLEWSGETLGRFMRFFGPISSLFDLLTFVFLYFVLCPGVCGGSFSQLSQAGQAGFIALFQTGWFLESMWTQVLILHLLRTKRVPLIQSRPSAPVMLVTFLGVVVFTLLTFSPLGAIIGLTAMPGEYFGFLAGTVAAYLLLVSVAKSRYLKKYRELF